MNLDELKSGLTTLAGEMAPFEGDVRALHRHERRRRIVVSSIALAVVVVLAVATVAISRGRDSGKVHVAGLPGKEVTADKITHVDAIVVPASPAARQILEASPSVIRYAPIPHGDRSGSLLSVPNLGLCALQTRDGYAVDLASPVPLPVRSLLLTLGAKGAAYYDTTNRLGFDVEVFLEVKPPAGASAAIQSAIDADPDVQSVRYVSKSDAYEIFKDDFAAQPALIESTKPSDLPESFRIVVKPGRSASAVVARYRHSAGVNQVLTPALAALFDPAGAIKDAAKKISPCTNP